MTQTYYRKNGGDLDINYMGNLFLDKVTLGLWDKIGIPRPLSDEDAKLVGRILRNTYNLYLKADEDVRDIYNMDDDIDKEELSWVLMLADFFETSGGLITEEEYYAHSQVKYAKENTK